MLCLWLVFMSRLLHVKEHRTLPSVLRTNVPSPQNRFTDIEFSFRFFVFFLLLSANFLQLRNKKKKKSRVPLLARVDVGWLYNRFAFVLILLHLFVP